MYGAATIEQRSRRNADAIVDAQQLLLMIRLVPSSSSETHAGQTISSKLCTVVVRLLHLVSIYFTEYYEGITSHPMDDLRGSC